MTKETEAMLAYDCGWEACWWGVPVRVFPCVLLVLCLEKGDHVERHDRVTLGRQRARWGGKGRADEGETEAQAHTEI